MEEKELLTVAEYAEILGISTQAVYKKLATRLQQFVVEVDGKKYIKRAALDDSQPTENQPTNQRRNQPTNHGWQPVSAFWENQITEKDKQIESLLRQIENLQQQNSSLTELLKNSQILLAAEKQLQIGQATAAEEPQEIVEDPQAAQQEQPTEEEEQQEEKKKRFWHRRKKKRKKNL